MVEPSLANAEDLKERGSGHFSLEAKLLGDYRQFFGEKSPAQ
jgi:hypothetical protein